MGYMSIRYPLSNCAEANFTISHIYRQYEDYLGWTLDYTGPQMILTLKLTSIAYNLKDGLVPNPSLSPDLAKRAITKVRVGQAYIHSLLLILRHCLNNYRSPTCWSTTAGSISSLLSLLALSLR